MTKVVAHQGSNDVYAPQTRAAYLQAIAEGADALECDVHLTRGGHVVCCHDETVDAASDGTGAIKDFTLDQLRRLDFTVTRPTPLPPLAGSVADQLLTLGELYRIAAEAPQPVGLVVELKHPSPYGDALDGGVLACLREEGWTPDAAAPVDVSFMSFDPTCVCRLGPIVGWDRVCQLVQHDLADAFEGDMAVMAAMAMRAGRQLIADGTVGLGGPSVEYCRANEDEVRAWLAAGRCLRVWTADTADDIDYLLDLGVQEITTNRTWLARERVAAR